MIRVINVVRLLLASLLLPFVKAAYRDDAPFRFDGITKEGLLREGFDASVKCRSLTLPISCPVWNEPPPEVVKRAIAFLLPNSRDRQGGRDVVALQKGRNGVGVK